jgi:hypothetical protein
MRSRLYCTPRHPTWRQAAEVTGSKEAAVRITEFNAQYPVGTPVEVLTPSGRERGHTIAPAGSYANLASVRVRLPVGERTFPLRFVRVVAETMKGVKGNEGGER